MNHRLADKRTYRLKLTDWLIDKTRNAIHKPSRSNLVIDKGFNGKYIYLFMA